MWITILTFITFLFFIFVASLFSLFIDQKEFFWKIFYIIVTWILAFLIAFISSDLFLKMFDSYLWPFVFLKNFQDLLTIEIEFAIFIANNVTLLIFVIYLFMLSKEYFYHNEIFFIKMLIFSLLYLNIFSILFVRFDLFLSNWELLQKDLLLTNIDIQIDYLTFMHEFLDEWSDFFKFMLFFYILILACAFKMITNNKILILRIIYYIFILTFELYFFGWLFVIDLFILFVISLCCIESTIFFMLVLKNLHKIHIKTQL